MTDNKSNRPLSDAKAAARCKYYLESGTLSMHEIADMFGFKSTGPLYAIKSGKLKGHIPAAVKRPDGSFTYPKAGQKPKVRRAPKKAAAPKPVKYFCAGRCNRTLLAPGTCAHCAKQAETKQPKNLVDEMWDLFTPVT